MQVKALYIRLKVVGPFSGLGASRSYMYWAALFIIGKGLGGHTVASVCTCSSGINLILPC
jgi:hypothetical protein